ncbi:MAG: Lrp/AsnC family transcriptional regulator [Thermoplasmata archaeon]
MDFDKKDVAILKVLSKNGRAQISEISKETNIPRITVYNRIQKLIKDGIIKKIVPLLNYKVLGLSVTAFILISFSPNFKLSQRTLAKKISVMKNVEEVHIIAGEWDLLVKVRGKTVEDVGSYVVDQLRNIEGVEKTMTIVAFETVLDEPLSIENVRLQ